MAIATHGCYCFLHFIQASFRRYISDAIRRIITSSLEALSNQTNRRSFPMKMLLTLVGFSQHSCYPGKVLGISPSNRKFLRCTSSKHFRSPALKVNTTIITTIFGLKDYLRKPTIWASSANWEDRLHCTRFFRTTKNLSVCGEE